MGGCYGIYVGRDGLLATSICHAKDGNRGHGECRHFSFSDTPEKAEEKLERYLTDRMDGRLDDNRVDGTAGGFLDAFRNWLVLEKGFDADSLRKPDDGEGILSAWFDGDRARYGRLLEEAEGTSLLEGMTMGESGTAAARRMTDAGIPIRIISSGTLDAPTAGRIESDTALWMDVNGMSAPQGHGDDGRDSVVDVLSSGDTRHDVPEVVSKRPGVTPADPDATPDERTLDGRYMADDDDRGR